MVYGALSYFAEGLSDHLSRVFALRDEVVQLSSPGERGGAPPNKLLVTLANIERETAGGIAFVHRPSGERLVRHPPGWQVNIYVLVAAFFAAKQYCEGLRLLSEGMRYIQGHPVLTLSAPGDRLTVEPVNLSLSELSNLWSVFGGCYRPSILCKIRTLAVAGDEISGTAVPILKKETGL